MIQVTAKEFDSLESAVEYVNVISIKYGYVKDYKIIETDRKYTILINFDIPEVKQCLTQARLKHQRTEEFEPCLNKIRYTIDEAEKENEENNSFPIHFDIEEMIYGLLIHGGVSSGEFYDYIKIEYDDSANSFNITLYDFELESHLTKCSSYISRTFSVDIVDHKMVYDHLVSQIQKRGFLLDVFSLMTLERAVLESVNWINSKDFREMVKAHKAKCAKRNPHK